MMTKIMRTFLAGLAASIAASIGGAADATELNFSYDANILDFQFQANWTQSSTPIPASYVLGQSTMIAVTGTETILFDGLFFSGGSINGVTFNSASNGGGFSDGLLIFDNGPQIYSGLESAPAFSPDVYNLLQGALTVTSAPSVPEPATWMMMFAGFGVIGMAARGWRKHSVAYT